jgi:peptide-methionine (S)-S-oxide reductase
MEKATFAAGCFWGVEAVFEKTEGVEVTTVGYTGGNTKNPTYEQVCTGETGHAEAVQILFNPEQITYEQLLETFWMIHDPTQKNRQGPDIGTQYRSAIFYHNQKQKLIAEQLKKQKEKDLGITIQTEITPAKEFYPAEEYHQKYLKKQGRTSRST